MGRRNFGVRRKQPLLTTTEQDPSKRRCTLHATKMSASRDLHDDNISPETIHSIIAFLITIVTVSFRLFPLLRDARPDRLQIPDGATSDRLGNVDALRRTCPIELRAGYFP